MGGDLENAEVGMQSRLGECTGRAGDLSAKSTMLSLVSACPPTLDDCSPARDWSLVVSENEELSWASWIPDDKNKDEALSMRISVQWHSQMFRSPPSKAST